MFSKIDIGIKTFLRDRQLFNAIDGIQANFPNARMIVVDDGEMSEEKYNLYARLECDGHVFGLLPFDSGFGRKSNRIVELSTRPYLLIGSDDFEFDYDAAQGLLELQKVLDHCPDVDIASGVVNHNSYEFYLDISECSSLGIFVKERPVFSRDAESFTLCHVRDKMGEILTPEFFYCDLTVNYSLIRRRVVKPLGTIWGHDGAVPYVKWDDDVKIGGGEHGAFFYDCKLSGFKTVCVPSANINEQKIRNTPRYKQFRNRANSPERPCFDKRNIVEYVLGDGRVDYRRGNDQAQ